MAAFDKMAEKVMVEGKVVEKVEDVMHRTLGDGYSLCGSFKCGIVTNLAWNVDFDGDRLQELVYDRQCRLHNDYVQH